MMSFRLFSWTVPNLSLFRGHSLMIVETINLWYFSFILKCGINLKLKNLLQLNMVFFFTLTLKTFVNKLFRFFSSQWLIASAPQTCVLSGMSFLSQQKLTSSAELDFWSQEFMKLNLWIYKSYSPWYVPSFPKAFNQLDWARNVSISKVKITSAS